jgi:hypothetical protein
VTGPKDGMYFDIVPFKIWAIALIVALPLLPVALLVAILIVMEKWGRHDRQPPSDD